MGRLWQGDEDKKKLLEHIKTLEGELEDKIAESELIHQNIWELKKEKESSMEKWKKETTGLKENLGHLESENIRIRTRNDTLESLILTTEAERKSLREDLNSKEEALSKSEELYNLHNKSTRDKINNLESYIQRRVPFDVSRINQANNSLNLQKYSSELVVRFVMFELDVYELSFGRSSRKNT